MAAKDISREAAFAAWKVKARLVRYRAVMHFAALRAARKAVRHTVYFWPAFDRYEGPEMQDTQGKVRHYLKGLDVAAVYFVREKEVIYRYQHPVASESRVVKSVVNNGRMRREVEEARYRVNWKYLGRPRGNSLRPWLYWVAEGPNCFGAADWLRLVKDVFLAQRPLPRRNVDFPSVPVKSCAILGTGPSLDRFMEESERWDAWIGANTLVCDRRIWGKGKPFAHCMLDPYTFCPTDHWKPMIEGSFRLLRETQAVLVTALDFAPYIELNFPEDIKKKCYYVSTLGHDTFRVRPRFDLANLQVTFFGNVLTDLMLPLACAITREAILYGCDGRPPGATLNFPKSAALQKYDDAWIETKYEHVDEDYYSQWMQSFSLYTRAVVDDCLKAGLHIRLRCPSWNEGLQKLPIYAE